jgi:ubiquinone biosynthesis protein
MSPSTAANEPSAVASFEVYQTLPRQSLLRRFLTTERHLFGLVFGALAVDVEERRGTPRGRGLGFFLERLLNLFTRPFLHRDLRDLRFPVQLRRRLEMLGPTYIKLGQILSLREDILPKSITEELKHLLATLPAVPYPVFCELIVRGLGRPLDDMFLTIDETPLGSASIGQVHRATTRDGDAVIIKVVKPGIPAILRRDAKLLGMAGWMLELVFPQYGPRRIIREFAEYTLREVDLRREADNAETFAANFTDESGIVFPKIYREFSGERVLTMEFFDGDRPDSPKVQAMPLEDRERLVDLGAEAIIRMIYKDGFFHADLHPGNLIVLPGPKAGFIDLGMVGRMHDELRRTLLYYYYALVMGDAENAARYLSAAAEPGRGGDPAGFRRDVAEISTRWRRNSDFDSFSLGQLILESVSRGAQYRMFFPVEMVLMVKALVTFEGVGQMLLPGFNVAEVSKKHVRSVFVQQFSPVRLAQEGLRGAPDLVDALVKMPLLITEGLRVIEKTAKRSNENPLAGLRGTLIAGFSLVAGAIIMGFVGPQAWMLYVPFFVIALILAVRKGE